MLLQLASPKAAKSSPPDAIVSSAFPIIAARTLLEKTRLVILSIYILLLLLLPSLFCDLSPPPLPFDGVKWSGINFGKKELDPDGLTATTTLLFFFVRPTPRMSYCNHLFPRISAFVLYVHSSSSDKAGSIGGKALMDVGVWISASTSPLPRTTNFSNQHAN